MPRGLTASEWAGQMTVTLSRFGVVPSLTDDSLWQEWANVVANFPVIDASYPPDPYAFEEFAEWAERFIQIEPLQEL